MEARSLLLWGNGRPSFAEATAVALRAMAVKTEGKPARPQGDSNFRLHGRDSTPAPRYACSECRENFPHRILTLLRGG